MPPGGPSTAALASADVAWGIGLRHQHFRDLEPLAVLPVLEVMSDNLIAHRGGPALARTRALAQRARVVLHGVGLNLGSADDLDWDYIARLRRLADELGARIVSDHLAFTRAGGIATYELLPVARHGRYLEHIAARVEQVQEVLGRPLAIENVSAYVDYVDSAMSEGEFFSELARRSGCGVLLDVNNLYVNAVNFGFDARAELAKFPLASVQQIHVAGHTARDGYLFDTHDQTATPAVVGLLRAALSQIAARDLPVIVEWDAPDASLAAPLGEVRRLQAMLAQPPSGTPVFGTSTVAPSGSQASAAPFF